MSSWVFARTLSCSVTARADLDTVIDRLSAFEARYNQAARPFKWKFTTTDLANLLDRLDQHQPSQAGNPAQPRAA